MIRSIIFCLIYLSYSSAAQANTHRLDFSDRAIDAINSGVLLQIDSEFGHIVSLGSIKIPSLIKTHRFYLSRHALSNRYLVRIDDSEFPHIFRSIAEAAQFVSVRARALFDNYHSGDEALFMRLQLNKYQLPAPMRLNAFISKDWDIKTQWSQ